MPSIVPHECLPIQLVVQVLCLAKQCVVLSISDVTKWKVFLFVYLCCECHWLYLCKCLFCLPIVTPVVLGPPWSTHLHSLPSCLVYSSLVHSSPFPIPPSNCCSPLSTLISLSLFLSTLSPSFLILTLVSHIHFCILVLIIFLFCIVCLVEWLLIRCLVVVIWCLWVVINWLWVVSHEY